MAIYIITFIISDILFALGAKGHNKKTFWFFAILLPCLLAACRADTIGTDTSYYPHDLFNNAQNAKSLYEYLTSDIYYSWQYTPIYQLEFGYTFLIFLIQRIFNNIVVIFFITELLIILPIVAILNKLENKCPIWLGMLVFYFLYYNVTLNTMRQWIAVSFLLLGSIYLFDKKPKKYFLFLFIAVFFHQSALIGIFIFLFYKIITMRVSIRINSFIISSTRFNIISEILISIMLIFGLRNVLYQFAIELGFGRYAAYLNGQISFSINQLILQLPIIFLLILEWRNIFNKNENSIENRDYNLFMVGMAILNIFILQLSTISDNTWRISLYFGCFNILLFPVLYEVEKYRHRKIMVIAVICIYLAIYWIYYFVYLGAHDTIPFVFRFLQ